MLLSHKFSFKGLGVLHKYSLNNSAEVGDLKILKKKKKRKKKKEKGSYNVSAALEGWPTSVSLV